MLSRFSGNLHLSLTLCRSTSGSDIKPKQIYSVRLGGNPVLKIAAVVLLLLWILGLATGRTLGGFVHVLLVLALVLWLISAVRGKNAGGWPTS